MEINRREKSIKSSMLRSVNHHKSYFTRIDSYVIQLTPQNHYKFNHYMHFKEVSACIMNNSAFPHTLVCCDHFQ